MPTDHGGVIAIGIELIRFTDEEESRQITDAGACRGNLESFGPTF
jgi:hypothetical protein